MRNPENTRTAILEAAKRILVKDGVLALTLDEVAKCASISKGGVLYHYPNKEALVLAVLQRELDLFDEEVERLQRQDPVAQGAYTRAYLRACVEEYDRGINHGAISCLEQFRDISAAQELVRSYANRCQQQVENEGLDPTIASLVRYASDGIWLAARVGSAKPATYNAVVRKLFEMAGTPSSPVSRAQEPN